MQTQCNQEKCSKPIYARAVCKSHYTSLRSKGLLNKLPPKDEQICTKAECDKPHSAKGLCEKHYREHKVEANPNVYRNIELKRKVRKREYKIKAISLMGGACSICGYNKNAAGLDFHHIDTSKKENEPRYALRQKDFDAAMNELAKCILVCKNCHAEIHHPNMAIA